MTSREELAEIFADFNISEEELDSMEEAVATVFANMESCEDKQELQIGLLDSRERSKLQ